MDLHLVDGTDELFRAFYAPAKKRLSGRARAVRMLLRSLGSLLREPGVEAVAVAFDHVIESFRNELFDGYKTGEGIDPALEAQFPLAERAAGALGLVVWPMVEFEADDALGTAADRFDHHPEVGRIYLCSPDKDLAQSVRGDRVVMLDRRRGKLLDEPGVVDKFGVPPASIPDWLGLVGDTADGIPGIPRWGAKSAATVLARYGRIEAIPADEADWDLEVRGAKSLAAQLRDRRDDALFYRRLATLRTDVPLPEQHPDELRWRGVDESALSELADELDDPRIVDRAPRG